MNPKMGRVLEQMMALPVNLIVAGMESVTTTMHGIQQASAIPEGADEEDGEGERKSSTLKNVSKLAITPFFQILKLPGRLLGSGVTTFSNAMREIQRPPESDEEWDDSTQAAAKFADQIVPLSTQEIAIEASARLSSVDEEAFGETLWRIGRPGRSEFRAKWRSEFNYHVGTDLDQVNAPKLPNFIGVHGSPKVKGGTERLNINFTVDRDYAAGQLAFIYDRWGGEKDQVMIDGKLLSPVAGAGRGKYKHVALRLGDLASGAHVITITTFGETDDGGHRIDYLQLAAVAPAAK